MKRIFGADTLPLISVKEFEEAEKAVQDAKATEAKENKQKPRNLSQRPR